MNAEKIFESLVTVLIAGAITWAFGKILRLSKDMNSAFHKIRNLESTKEQTNGRRKKTVAK